MNALKDKLAAVSVSSDDLSNKTMDAICKLLDEVTAAESIVALGGMEITTLEIIQGLLPSLQVNMEEKGTADIDALKAELKKEGVTVFQKGVINAMIFAAHSRAKFQERKYNVAGLSVQAGIQTPTVTIVLKKM